MVINATKGIEDTIKAVMDELSGLDRNLRSVATTKSPLWTIRVRTLEAAGLINYGNEQLKATMISETVVRLDNIKRCDPERFILAAKSLKISLSRDSRSTGHISDKYFMIPDVIAIVGSVVYLTMTSGTRGLSGGTEVAVAGIVGMYAVAQIIWKALAIQHRHRTNDRDSLVEILELVG